VMMTEENGKDKAEVKEKKPRKPLEYRRFERLLKRVIAAPPMRRNKSHSDNSKGRNSRTIVGV